MSLSALRADSALFSYVIKDYTIRQWRYSSTVIDLSTR
jgi:hypothetical protein